MLRRKSETLAADQGGFTLVELLVSTAILAIVAASVCSFILIGFRNYASANSDIALQQEAQFALNQMADVLIDTTRSVSYIGYAGGVESSQAPALEDSEFGFEPEGKSLIMYNGILVEPSPPVPGAAASAVIEPGNGNKHYHFYWDKTDETLYYAELDVQPTDVRPQDVQFPAFGDPGWEVFAEQVTDFSVDLSQTEEKRVVKLKLTFANGQQEYSTSNNVTIRNKVAVNDAPMEPLQ